MSTDAIDDVFLEPAVSLGWCYSDIANTGFRAGEIGLGAVAFGRYSRFAVAYRVGCSAETTANQIRSAAGRPTVFTRLGFEVSSKVAAGA